jgi:hypothetical protein
MTAWSRAILVGRTAMASTEPPPSLQQVTARFWDYYQVWIDFPGMRMAREQMAAWLRWFPWRRRRGPGLLFFLWNIGTSVRAGSHPWLSEEPAQWERIQQAAEAVVVQAYARLAGATEPVAREVVRQVAERLAPLDPRMVLGAEDLGDLVGELPGQAELRQAATALLGWYAAGGERGDAGLAAVQQAYASLAALDRHEPERPLPATLSAMLRLAVRGMWQTFGPHRPNPHKRAAYRSYVGAWRAWFAQQSASPSAS